jgi:hypothetical protein
MHNFFLALGFTSIWLEGGGGTLANKPNHHSHLHNHTIFQAYFTQPMLRIPVQKCAPIMHHAFRCKGN